MPSHVSLEPSAASGLVRPSFVKCEQVLTVSKSRLVRRLGRLAEAEVTRVAAALRIVLDL